MKIAVTILVLFLVLLDFGLITACGVMERRLKDDDLDAITRAVERSRR